MRGLRECLCRVLHEREEHDDQQVEIILIPHPGDGERCSHEGQAVLPGVLSQLGRHGQLEPRHNEEYPEVGGQELAEQGQFTGGVSQARVPRYLRHSQPGPAGQPQQGVGRGGQADTVSRLYIITGAS